MAALALLMGPLFAQGIEIFESAPPQVDQALRSRVTQFYQFHVEGKFRQADALVHEESKDAFFVAEKLKLKSFEIKHIKYEENFTQARVTTVVPVDLDLPGFGTMKDVPRPLVSFWKLDGGQWWWRTIPYDPCKGIESGSITLHKKKCVDGKVVEDESSSPADVTSKGVSIKELQSMVQASGNSISLPSHLPAREGVRITNNFPGPVTLQVLYEQMPGLEVRVDSDKIESGGSTTLVIDHKPVSPTFKPEMLIRVLVQPTAQVIPIKLQFQVPPANLASGVTAPEKQ